MASSLRDVNQPPGSADPGPFAEELPALVENLDALVAPVGHIHPLFGIEHHVVHQVELPVAGSLPAPVPHIFALRIELDHARVHVSVGNIEISVGPEGHVGRLVEPVVRVVGPWGPLTLPEHHQDPALRAELENHVARHVHAPDAPVRPHAQPVRRFHREGLLGPRLEHLATAVEFHHRPMAPVEYPHVALPVDIHAGRFAEVIPFGHLRPIRRDVERQRRPGLQFRDFLCARLIGRPPRRQRALLRFESQRQSQRHSVPSDPHRLALPFVSGNITAAMC